VKVGVVQCGEITAIEFIISMKREKPKGIASLAEK